jgi:FAD/FMN-containing dehydrogenase
MARSLVVLFSLLSIFQVPLLTYAAPDAATNQTCSEIKNKLPYRLKYPDDLAYWKENRDYYNIGLAELGPACIVFPGSAEDVSEIVKIFNKIPNVQFAVKSGGHSPNPGHSSIKDGVLIAMRDMVGTQLDVQKKVAYVKPGGHWWDVYKVLERTGWTVVGGRLGTIGIGGFLLQGGVSFLSGEHGLAADVSANKLRNMDL